MSTKLYTREITCCADCPECNWDVCYATGKKVDIDDIPSFCPLEDWEEWRKQNC